MQMALGGAAVLDICILKLRWRMQLKGLQAVDGRDKAGSAWHHGCEEQCLLRACAASHAQPGQPNTGCAGVRSSKLRLSYNFLLKKQVHHHLRVH